MRANHRTAGSRQTSYLATALRVAARYRATALRVAARYQLSGTLLAAMLLCPLAAQAQLTPSCGPRFQSAFVRANAILTQREMASPGRATIEVSNLFGPRQDLCEPGAYQAFLDSFVDLARSAIRAPAKQRDGAIRVATAVIGVLPTQVPPQELKSAGASFRQVRSDLYAIADDVGNRPDRVQRRPRGQHAEDREDREEPAAEVAVLGTHPQPEQHRAGDEHERRDRRHHDGRHDGRELARLIDHPHFARLTHLDVVGLLRKHDLWKALAKSKTVGRFHKLRLGFPIDDTQLNALLDNPEVCKIGHLALPSRVKVSAKTQRRYEKVFGVKITRDW